jgi:hypothetical protein
VKFQSRERYQLSLDISLIKEKKLLSFRLDICLMRMMICDWISRVIVAGYD